MSRTLKIEMDFRDQVGVLLEMGGATLVAQVHPAAIPHYPAWKDQTDGDPFYPREDPSDGFSLVVCKCCSAY